MNYAEQAVRDHLSPLRLHFYLTNACPLDEIARAHKTDVATVQLLMRRWGLDHLSGRSKSDVVLVRKATGGMYG
jgi:hypothetical protein